MRRFPVLLFIAILFLPFSAHAGSLEVSPYAGKFFFDNDTNLKDKPVLGLRLGYGLTDRFALEVAAEFINTRVSDPAKLSTERPPFGSPDGSVRTFLYHLDAVYNFLPYARLSPFIAAGGGGANFDTSSTGAANRFLANAGVGAKYWISDKFALRADVRDVMFFDKTFHNLSATVGLSFGKRPKRPVPAVAEAPAPPPPPAPAPPPPPPAPTPPPPPEKPKPVTLEEIHFDFDRADIRPEDTAILNRHVQFMKDNPDVILIIEGHACAHGPDEYNLALSKKRADNVRDYFITNGIPAERLKTEYYGESRLAMPEIPTPFNKNSPEAVANRRVHFVIVR